MKNANKKSHYTDSYNLHYGGMDGYFLIFSSAKYQQDFCSKYITCCDYG